jgi:hypothetical protein
LPESLRGLALSAADVATVEAKQVENARKYRLAAEAFAAQLEAERVDLLAGIAIDPVVAEHSTLTWIASAPQVYTLRVGTTRFEIRADAIGNWHITRTAEDGREAHIIVDSEAAAFQRADAAVEKTGQRFFVERDAPWRRQPPTDKQIKTLGRFGQNVPGITRGDASLLITKIIHERGTRRRHVSAKRW